MNGIKGMWIAVAAVAAVALVIVGYAWGASKGSGGVSIIGNNNGGYDSGFAAGMAAARKKLQESGLIPTAPASITTISGTVKSVGSNSFVIAANPVSMNPLDVQGPTQRTIMVSDKTKISVRVGNNPEEMTAAMKEFQDNIKAGKGGIPPSPFTMKTTTIDDIKIGMIVTITAAENIKDATTINAVDIIFDAVPTPGKP